MIGIDALPVLQELRGSIQTAALSDDEKSHAIELADGLVERCSRGTLTKVAMLTAIGALTDIAGTEHCLATLRLHAQA